VAVLVVISQRKGVRADLYEADDHAEEDEAVDTAVVGAAEPTAGEEGFEDEHERLEDGVVLHMFLDDGQGFEAVFVVYTNVKAERT